MLVYLMRHGKAERSATWDEGRELTVEGVLQNRSVIKKLFSRSPIIDKGFVSPFERAKQTAADFHLVFPGVELEETRLLIPESDPYDVLNLLEEKQDHHLILIAHNPLLSRLFSLLVDGTTEGARQVETSNALCIMMGIIAPGCGELKYVLSHD